MTKGNRTRGFELVARWKDSDIKFKAPARGSKKSACYDMFNNTGEDIVLAPNEISDAIPTGYKSYMLDDEVLKAFVRSGHGFGYSVRLANSTGFIDCVPAGTLISTPDGDIPVEKLMNQKHVIVYSYNEQTECIEEDMVDDIWIVNDKELLTITTEDDTTVTIPTTKEVLTKRGWIKAIQLTNTDEILSI